MYELCLGCDVSGHSCGGCHCGELAEAVAVDVSSLADVGILTVGVADLGDGGMAFPADPAGLVTVGVASLANAEMVIVGATDSCECDWCSGVWECY